MDVTPIEASRQRANWLQSGQCSFSAVYWRDFCCVRSRRHLLTVVVRLGFIRRTSDTNTGPLYFQIIDTVTGLCGHFACRYN